MAIQGFVLFLFLFLIESGKLRKDYSAMLSSTHAGQSSIDDTESRTEVHEDSDVKQERECINSSEINSLISKESIVIKNLAKVYGNFTAVDKICVSVGKQECFGLLGQNGAGKTTTFKMLTGDVVPTTGNAWMNTHDIQHEMKTVCLLISHRKIFFGARLSMILDKRFLKFSLQQNYIIINNVVCVFL